MAIRVFHRKDTHFFCNNGKNSSRHTIHTQQDVHDNAAYSLIKMWFPPFIPSYKCSNSHLFPHKNVLYFVYSLIKVYLCKLINIFITS